LSLARKIIVAVQVMNDKPSSPIAKRAALYARVSSEQQAKRQTIASQVAALQERIMADGLTVEPELCYLDDG
jgi:site-specific DNA recombinase